MRTRRMQEILTRIVKGEGKEGDIELLEELCEAVKDGALCGLGQTAPNPVLTTIRYFKNEYEAHIRDKKCPAKECVDLLTYSIDADKCKGCKACMKIGCPAISIKNGKARVDATLCVGCGVCEQLCAFDALCGKEG